MISRTSRRKSSAGRRRRFALKRYDLFRCKLGRGSLMVDFIYLQSLIRDMDQTIRAMSEQMKFISMSLPAMSQGSLGSRSSGSPSTAASATFSGGQSPMNPAHHRAPTLPSMSSNYPPPNYQQGPPPSSLHNQWYGPPLTGSHGNGQSGLPPSASQNVMQQPPPPTGPRPEEMDDTFLAVLGTQDMKQLRELLARSTPDVIMPTSGTGPLSQAVILTLVHRVSHLCSFVLALAFLTADALSARWCDRRDVAGRRGVQDVFVVAAACFLDIEHKCEYYRSYSDVCVS